MARYTLGSPGDWYSLLLDDGSRLQVDVDEATDPIHEFCIAVVNLWQQDLMTKASIMAAQRSRFGPPDSTDLFVGRTAVAYVRRHSVECGDAVDILYADVPGVSL